jgi:hypothetical protein
MRERERGRKGEREIGRERERGLYCSTWMLKNAFDTLG